MGVLVVSPLHPEPGSVTSGWAASLVRQVGATHLLGAGATREAFLARLGPDVAGIAFFGHGDADRLCAEAVGAAQSPLPVLVTSADAALLAGRWVFALACCAATRLGPDAVRAGCAVFAGYRHELAVTELTAAENAMIEPLAVTVPLALFGGMREARSLEAVQGAAARGVSESLGGGQRFMLLVLVQQLAEITVLG